MATLGVVTVLFYFFQEAAYNPTLLKTSLYFPTHKVAWCVCLWWISYACLTESAGVINWFLSLPFFQILSRVTYSTYLVHVIVQVNHVKLLRQLFYFTDYELVRNWCELLMEI